LAQSGQQAVADPNGVAALTERYVDRSHRRRMAR
jgi:hypothetical protein